MIVTELMKTTLKSLLQDLNKNKKSLNVWEICQITSDIGHGLEYLHVLDIIHRDLNAGNILFDEKMQAKIGDFGQSRFLPEPRTQNTPNTGAMFYLSPQGFTKNYTFALDIWSCGMLITQMVVNNLQEPQNYTWSEVIAQFSEPTELTEIDNLVGQVGDVTMGEILGRRNLALNKLNLKLSAIANPQAQRVSKVISSTTNTCLSVIEKKRGNATNTFLAIQDVARTATAQPKPNLN